MLATLQPKWDFEVQRWTDFQHTVEIWAGSNDIAHLLKRDPYPHEKRKHEPAMRTVMLKLPPHDRAYVRGHDMLHEVWSMLNKYMPSVAAGATKLWIRCAGLRQRGRPMQEHINECMTVRNKLLAINEPFPDRQFTHNCRM